MLQHARTWKAIALAGAWLLLAAVIFLFLVAAAMHKGLNHDENMYVAGGVLLGRQGLWPYTGFSFFQMPYLEFLYGALFGLSQAGDLLLWARLINVVAATLSCMVLAWTGWTLASRRWSVASGQLVGLCGPAILICSPVFVYASGLAWNHDLPVLCTLVATVSFAAAARREKRSGLLVAAGVFVGLATGFRLAFLPVLLPLFVGALLLPGQNSPRNRVRSLALVAGGASAALLPALALFLRDPSAFVFANLRYHQVNELYWQQLGYDRAMTWAGKAQYLWDLLLGDPANWALVASLVVVLALLAVMAVRRVPLNLFPFLFACSVALSLLVGAVIPSPTWLQYLYAPVSVLVLALLYGVAALTEGRRTKDER